MVCFGKTIQGLPDGTRYLLPPRQPENDAQALADFRANGVVVLFVNNLEWVWHGLPHMQDNCSVVSRFPPLHWTSVGAVEMSESGVNEHGLLVVQRSLRMGLLFCLRPFVSIMPYFFGSY